MIRSPLDWLWTNTGFCQAPLALHILGAGAMLVFAATKMTIEGPGGIAQAILVVSGFIILVMHGRHLRNSAPVWFLLAVIMAQLLSWFAGYLSHPELVDSIPKVDRLARIFLLVPIAWWLGGSTRNTLILWSIAAAGILLMPWLLGNGWDEWRQGLAGRRVDFAGANSFAARNAQHTAMLFGVITLGLLVFAKRAVWAGRLVWWRLILWVGFLSASVTAVIITQTRAVWLGLMWAFLAYAMGAVIGIVLIPKLRQQLIIGSAGLLVGMLVVGILSGLLGDEITKRLSHERQTIARALDGHVDAVGYGSVGLRIHSWEAALDGIAERPLLGWGGSGTTLVLERSTDKQLQALVSMGLGHLHNSHLQVLINYGILGAGILAAFFLWLTWRAIQAWRANYLPSDLLLFYLGFVVFWLAVNFFESYLFYSTGIFVLNLVLAGVVTHIWHWEFTPFIKTSRFRQIWPN